MSSPPQIDRFKGTDWEECNEFILAIRARALREGKQRDTSWMADFAAPNFSHKALLWHCRLPQDVRQDWFKLETALIDRWGPSEDDDGPRIEPVPAAAPSQDCSSTIKGPTQFVLKVVFDGSRPNSYVHYQVGYRFCDLTGSIEQALRIRRNSLSGATLLERIDGSHHSWLAAHMALSEPDLRRGSTDFCILAVVDSYTLKSSGDDDDPWQLPKCTISTNGEVILLWRTNDDNAIALGAFCSAAGLYLAVDSDAYSKKCPDEKRARIFLEAID